MTTKNTHYHPELVRLAQQPGGLTAADYLRVVKNEARKQRVKK